ncbi:MAG: ABC transporter ATP-binding protein [Telmatospirillum sp.]|nr:ABC transporter ATP-binding protein [Telmatospirillum sp.]
MDSFAATTVPPRAVTSNSADARATGMPVLDLRGLTVEIPTRRGVLVPVRDVSLAIAPGEVLGVVGESGAGKSMLGSAIVGLLEKPARRAAGTILLDGQRIDNLTPSDMRRVRGRRIGAIYQDPLTALDPLFSIGSQVVETIRCHLPLGAVAARDRALSLLDRVGIASPTRWFDRLPHELSGGMRQRVVIALAIAGEPRLLVADEPTTALDVSIQAQIVDLLKSLCRDMGMAILLITHDMGVIAEIADRVAVMYAGRIAELGRVGRVVQAPAHPYTAGLMGAIPDLGVRRMRLAQIEGAMPRLGAIPSGCAFHPRCAQADAQCASVEPPTVPDAEATGIVACWHPATALSRAEPPASGLQRPNIVASSRDEGMPLVAAVGLTKHFRRDPNWLERHFGRERSQIVRAVDGVDFAIPRGSTFALVGESGSGKSTVAKLCVGLLAPTAGAVLYGGADMRTVERSGRLQMVFQDPGSSLDPRWRVCDVIGEPLRARGPILYRDARRRTDELLERVGLAAADGDRWTHEFSGGQRQRISIARALACEPEFLVCDEPTSALDVSVQAQILNLMQDIQRERQLTYLFISHNLAVVSQIADTVGVMYRGRLVEVAKSATLFAAPRHPYTRQLLDAIPRIGGTARASVRRLATVDDSTDASDDPVGCRFRARCGEAADICSTDNPPEIDGPAGRVACYRRT